MGANAFTTFASGRDLSEAFESAVAQARFEHGHGGYSGTLAEKSSCVLISSTPRLLADALELANELIDNDDERIDDKWGPAGAIAVGEAEMLATRTVTVKLPNLVGAWVEGSARDELVKSHLKAGERIDKFSIVDDTSTWKASTVRCDGEAVKRYYVCDSYGHRTSARTYPTISAARTALKAWLTSVAKEGDKSSGYQLQGNQLRGEAGFAIRGEIVTPDGGPLVEGAIERRRRVTTVEATLCRYGPVGPVTGWVLFGTASS
jgi:hypothetical protein